MRKKNVSRLLRATHALSLGLTFVTSVAAQTPPSADAKRECVSSYERAQVLRNSGNMLEALDALVTCSQQVCHPALRTDCVQWHQEVKAAIPTVVLTARSPDQDLFDVRVYVDGKLVARRLDGRPIELNPGSHKFRFETANYAAEERQLLLVPGEKLRAIVITFDDAEQPDAAAPAPGSESPLAAEPSLESPPPAPVDAPAPKAAPPSRPVPPLSYVFGAVALAGVAGFAGFGLSGLEDYNSLDSSCRPGCPSSDVDSVRTKLILADVSLGVAVASAVTATIFYLNRPWVGPGASPQQGMLTPSIGFDPVQEAASVNLGGRF
jgi:hypothetical protein